MNASATPARRGCAAHGAGWFLCAIGLAVGALSCWAAAARAVSYQGERDLGRRFDLAVRQRVPMVDDPEVVGYVTEVGRRIVAGLDDSYFEYQFAVVRDPRVNAFAVPGGYVYANSGLVARVKNED